MIKRIILSLLTCLFILSCNKTDTGQQPSGRIHEWYSEPVKLYVSNELSQCQKGMIESGISYWEKLGNKNLIDTEYVNPKQHYAFIVGPKFNEAIVETGPMSAPDTLDQVEWIFVKGDDRLLFSAIMTIKGCSARAIAHEIGHLLGFDHAQGNQMLMTREHHPDAWRVDPSEYNAL